MKSIKMGIAMLAVLAACVSQFAQAETVIVSTLTGNDKRGFSDGQGENARFSEASGIAIDADGNLYVADTKNFRIRKVTPRGEVSTLAGSHIWGFADGQGSSAWFSNPRDVTLDAEGNLYVADSRNNRIRKVTPQGEVSTLAGEEEPGFADGKGSAARFNNPHGITMDRAGNLYVADRDNNRIRKVTQKGEVSTLAGGEYGFADGEGENARFYEPHRITIDRMGNLYVTDDLAIRKVTQKGEVTTLAGGKPGFADGEGQNARFYVPRGITIDADGNLYVVDTGNQSIRKITKEGKVSTLVDGRQGFVDEEGNTARFSEPDGIAIDQAGNLYVTEHGSSRIRKIVIQRP